MVFVVLPGCSKEQQHFGHPIGEEDAVAVIELVNQPESYLNKRIVVRGLILEVCQTSGCWCILQDGKDQLYVSLQTFTLPGKVAGKSCRVAGKLIIRNDRLTFLATGIDLLQ